MNDINDLLYLDNVYVSDLKSHISECIDLYMNENIVHPLLSGRLDLPPIIAEIKR